MTTQLSHIDPHVRGTIISAYSEIANYFKEHCTFTDEERENLEHSPERVARALFEMVFTTDEIEQKLGVILRKVFPLASAETTRFLWPLPIIQGPILVHGICPHHFLPIMYSVTYGYSALEGNGVLGLSKLTRIAKILARRPIMQEQYTKDLASVLTRHTISGTYTLGNDREFVQAPLAGAIVTGAHCCMLCRGVESPATTTTESLDYSQWYQTNEEYGLPVSGSNITNDPQAKNLNEKLWLVHNHNHKVI